MLFNSIKESTYGSMTDVNDLILESVSDNVRDMFLDDPESYLIGAENDPKIKEFIDKIPEDDEIDPVSEDDIDNVAEEAYNYESDDEIDDYISSGDYDDVDESFDEFDDDYTLEGTYDDESDDEIDDYISSGDYDDVDESFDEFDDTYSYDSIDESFGDFDEFDDCQILHEASEAKNMYKDFRSKYKLRMKQVNQELKLHKKVIKSPKSTIADVTKTKQELMKIRQEYTKMFNEANRIPNDSPGDVLLRFLQLVLICTPAAIIPAAISVALSQAINDGGTYRETLKRIIDATMDAIDDHILKCDKKIAKLKKKNK